MVWLRRYAIPCLRGVLILLCLVYFVGPLLWLFATSFKQPLDLLEPNLGFLYNPSIQSYRAILGGEFQASFARYFWNSVIVSVVSTAATLFLGVLAGFGLVRLRPPGASKISFSILMVRMLPPIVLVVPLFILLSNRGLLDTRTALVVVYTAINIPLTTWLISGFMATIPRELEDAARIDGCSTWSVLWKVIAPILGPGVASAGIFAFTLSWNDLVLSLPLTSETAVTLPVLASRMRVEEGILWGQLGAVAVLMTIPAVVLVVFAQKAIVAGLVSGSVKG